MMSVPVSKRRLETAALALALISAAAPALSAQKANDAINDFIPTYAGPKGGDLDVVSAQVFYDPSIQKFAFTATLAAPIGTTAGAFYVWGLNKGAGTQGFATIAPGVLFDAVMIMRPTTGVTVGAATVSDFFFANGNMITALVPLLFFPSTGFTPENYTWNLWPRATGPAGQTSISDFAPDNSNNLVTVGAIPAAVLVTPEPASFALVGAGLLSLLVVNRRKSKHV